MNLPIELKKKLYELQSIQGAPPLLGDTVEAEVARAQHRVANTALEVISGLRDAIYHLNRESEERRLVIPKETVYYGLTCGEDPDWVSEELMLAQLLIDGVVCINDVHWCFDFYEPKEQIETKNYSGPRFQLKEGADPKEDTVCCFVNINDIFCYGADGTNVTTKELRSLYEHHMDFNNEYKGWGLVIWAIKKEKLKPIPKVLEPMIADGMWTEELELLTTKEK